MTLLAHWVLDDTNLGAKTCASRASLSPVLSLSNVSTLTFRDTYLPDARGSVTTRKLLNCAALSSGGGNGNIATCNNQAGFFTNNGRIVFDLVMRLADGVAFKIQMIDNNASSNAYYWFVSVADGALTITPQQFTSGSSTDDTEHVLRFVDLGVAKSGGLVSLTLELDASSSFATPRFTSYLNGELVGRSYSDDVAGTTYSSGNVDVRIVNDDTSTLNFLCEFMLSTDAVNLSDVRARARFQRAFKDYNPLPFLELLESTTLHLVGNDYVEGASTWIDRSLNNDATAVGAANITTSYSAHFLGRQAVKGAASSGFYAGGDVLTGSTERTYELVIEDFGPQAAEMVIGRLSDGATQHSFWFYKNSNSVHLSAVWPSDGFGTGFDHIHMGGGYLTDALWSLPIIVHLVVDAPGQTIDLWINGEQVSQTTNPLQGSLGTLATPNLGILGKFNTTSNTFDSGEYFTGKLLELARHEELFTPAMIAARVERFNELKGY